MTEALQRVVRRLERLPAPVQERVARRFMRALDEELQGIDDVPSEATPREDAPPVRFEDIEHLLGVFDGPGDLSTNKAYLDDLGERPRR